MGEGVSIFQLYQKESQNVFKFFFYGGVLKLYAQ